MELIQLQARKPMRYCALLLRVNTSSSMQRYSVVAEQNGLDPMELSGSFMAIPTPSPPSTFRFTISAPNRLIVEFLKLIGNW